MVQAAPVQHGVAPQYFGSIKLAIQPLRVVCTSAAYLTGKISTRQTIGFEKAALEQHPDYIRQRDARGIRQRGHSHGELAMCWCGSGGKQGKGVDIDGSPEESRQETGNQERPVIPPLDDSILDEKC